MDPRQLTRYSILWLTRIAAGIESTCRTCRLRQRLSTTLVGSNLSRRRTKYVQLLSFAVLPRKEKQEYPIASARTCVQLAIEPQERERRVSRLPTRHNSPSFCTRCSGFTLRAGRHSAWLACSLKSRSRIFISAPPRGCSARGFSVSTVCVSAETLSRCFIRFGAEIRSAATCRDLILPTRFLAPDCRSSLQ